MVEDNNAVYKLESRGIDPNVSGKVFALMEDLFGCDSEIYDNLRSREAFLNKTTGVIYGCKENCEETCKNFDCPRLWDLELDEIVDHPGVTDHEIVAITHKWNVSEVVYKNLAEVRRTNAVLEMLDKPLKSTKVSPMSDKLGRIREELKGQIRYVWMDTLCIDKDSSTELDMSIRSMYRWYKAAEFVYLESYTTLKDWSSRGWTLQEGIAAKSLKVSPLHGNSFLEAWTETGIPAQDLGFHENFRGMNSFGYLYLMSKRKTTRVEDMAYCLIGLLDVDINIAYGEGNKALIRLLIEVGLRGDISWILASIKYTIRIWDYFVRFPILENLHESYGGYYGTCMSISARGIYLQLTKVTGKRLKKLMLELFPGYKIPINKERTEILAGHHQTDSTTFYYDTHSDFVFGVHDMCIIYGRQVSRDMGIKLGRGGLEEDVYIWAEDIRDTRQDIMPLFKRCGVKRDIANGYYTTEPLKKYVEGKECDICSDYAHDDPRPRCPKVVDYIGPTA